MKRNIWPFVIISVTLCLFLIVFKPWSSGSSRNEPQTLAASSEPSPQTSTASANVSRAVPPSLSPYELFLKTKPDGIREVIEPEVEIRWQRPLEGVKLRAVALLFHGCTHNANHFFQLPEDRTVVRWLLAYGFAVVAISSADAAPAGSGCWDSTWPPSASEDVIRLSHARGLRRFLQRQQLDSLQLVGFGASSGGSFVSVFSRYFGLRAQIIQISPGVEEALSPGSTNAIPPTFFMYMQRDPWANEESIKPTVQRLRRAGINVETYMCEPRPLTPQTLNNHIEGFVRGASELFHQFAKIGQFIRGGQLNGYLKSDPRQTHLANVILGEIANAFSSVSAQVKEDNDNDNDNKMSAQYPELHRYLVTNGGKFSAIDVAAVEEVVNVLWAGHELTSEHIQEVCEWMLKAIDVEVQDDGRSG